MTQNQRVNQPAGARTRRSLSADDWIDVALAAIAEGGLSFVAVEPLAKRPGATKGSFYWHFANREALVEAALMRWEERNTEGVVTAVEEAMGEPTPEARLRYLFKSVPAATSGDPIEVALLANAHDPLVEPVLRRVTERRIDYTSKLFRHLGFTKAEARRRALLSYTSHLGQISLLHSVPHVLPATKNDRKRYLDTLVYTLTRT